VTYQVLVLNFVSDLLAVFGNEESCVLGQLRIDFRVVEQCVVHVEVVEERVLVLENTTPPHYFLQVVLTR
jgi:hypothetical protein